ncbi:hypothetical protein SAMN05216276_108623 [Streptosporangium subroseum]|uniref:Uncharacterized protein n=1 Tax=Streptosporangium subroseum TaxID=106412 RepID=A0A239P4D3_9ACTN|nr:hypothetical protein [Streptosporangium subroseum]SNT61936.1 hypothetical protein SAMN05216276_108623 [Streptosporangium subroseum]
MMNAVRVDVDAYELLWPTTLFITEGERIARSSGGQWSDRVTWLLTEALSGTTAMADFEDVANLKKSQQVDPWASAAPSRTTPTWGTGDGNPQREWFTELLSRANELRHVAAPRPYWPQRRSESFARMPGKPADVHQEFVRIITEFEGNGYLVEAFGERCVDGDEDLLDPAEVIDRRLGIAGLWPLTPAKWDEDDFYGLVEVFHDMVSRPRRRWFHSFSMCGWHYIEFHAVPGRTLYRWKINQMLSSAGIEYELAAEGKDFGRLVAVTDDARSHLVHQVLHLSTPGVKERVEHAIVLFRSRSASSESKRSAIVTLAGVLEERRQLIRDDIGKPDEGALFEIANRYDLRHRRTGQHGDYDAAFLDWIFWWYLATVELTNRLIVARTA